MSGFDKVKSICVRG